MAIKNGRSLILTATLSKDELQEYVDAIPDGVEIRTSMHTQVADRPWESDKTTVMLIADWEA